MTIRANYEYMTSYHGGKSVCFSGSVKHGKGTRSVGVVVGEDVLRKLATAMSHTDHVGHATWHVENPDRELPCSSCKATGDV